MTTNAEVKEKIADKTFDYLDKVSSQIGDILTEMGAKLGVASEHVYTTLVKQQIAEGIMQCVEFAIWLIILLVAAKIFVPIIKKYAVDGEEIIVSFLLGAILLVFAGCTIASAFDIPGAVARFVNPEYYAMKEIAKFIEDFMAKH